MIDPFSPRAPTMLRRDALRLLASTAAIPAFQGLRASQLLVLGRRIHDAHAVAEMWRGNI